ncbi:MAG: hypothetical protein AB2735_14655, partial [Candidatus Thiodiazotropha taylori]
MPDRLSIHPLRGLAFGNRESESGGFYLFARKSARLLTTVLFRPKGRYAADGRQSAQIHANR